MKADLILNALRESIPSESSLIIGVSGGIDSMVLLYALAELAREKSLILFGVHVDHGFREKSKLDASFVKSEFEKLKIQYRISTLEPLPNGRNLEEFGREGRYLAFESARIEQHADWILTAHHEGDVSESLLMQLLFGRRVFGISKADSQRKIIRPLLSAPKSEILQFAAERSVPWVEDESNQSTERLRNQIRLQILPFLRKELGDHVDASLAASSEEIGELAQGFSEHIKSQLQAELSRDEFGSKQWFRRTQDFINRYPALLHPFILEELFVPIAGFRLGAKHRKRLCEFWGSDSPQIELPSGLLVRRNLGGIRIIKSKEES